jgi:hypothetical protein
MKFKVPEPLRHEHEELHTQLARVTALGGPVGDAAKAVARVLHGHFLREEQIAMPPLGLLADVAAGRIVPEMSEVLALTDALTAELPKMLEEHSRIKAALGELERAAEEQKLPDLAEFARKLVLHARTEEDVLYPAAIILGDYLKAKLASAQAASGAAGQQS